MPNESYSQLVTNSPAGALLPTDSFAVGRSGASKGAVMGSVLGASFSVSNIAALQLYNAALLTDNQIITVTTPPTVPIIPGSSVNITWNSTSLQYIYYANRVDLIVDGVRVLNTAAGGATRFVLTNANFTISVSNSRVSVDNNMAAPFTFTFNLDVALNINGATLSIRTSPAGNITVAGFIDVQLPTFMSYRAGTTTNIIYPCNQNSVSPVVSQGYISNTALMRLFSVDTTTIPWTWTAFQITTLANQSGLVACSFSYKF